MDGLFINGRRPASKKAVKEAVATAPETVRVECTSMFPGGFDGLVTELPRGKKVTFVGPDPYTKRNFYGTIAHGPNGLKVT